MAFFGHFKKDAGGFTQDSSGGKPKNRWVAPLVYLLTVAGSILFLAVGNKIASQGLGYLTKQGDGEPVRAQVLKVYSRTSDAYDIGGDTTLQQVELQFSAKLLSGDRRGEEVLAVQSNDSFAQLEEVEPGDKVLLYYMPGSQVPWMMGEYVRTDGLLLLGVLFLAALLLFGRSKGINTIVSLVFTCLAVFLVLIPSVLSGQNIYWSSIIVCAFVIVMTLLIVSGFHRKTLAACCGCFGGVLLCGFLTVAMDGVLRLTGMVDEHSLYLATLNPENPINLKAVIFASIIIGAMGAIMDVAISLASSLWELYEQAAQPTPKMLIRSGFAIGRDMMGTMSNTLILAYIGSSMSVVLLLLAYNNSAQALLNREMIVVEILQALVGSLGILCTIPFTSVLCAAVYPHRRKRRLHGGNMLDLDHAFDEDSVLK